MRKILISSLGVIIIIVFLDLEKIDNLNIETTTRKFIKFLKKEIFENNIKIKEVIILNTNNLEKKEILDVSGIDWNLNIFEIDLQNIRKKLLNIKEVKSVKIKKKIGGKIEIYITEKVPFMYWEINNLKKVISSNGEVLNFPNFNESLFLVKGNNANNKIKTLIDKIKNNNSIYNQFLSAEYIDNYRWDIYLKENILVKLPFEDLTDSLKLLNEMLKNNNINNKKYTVIDMRVKGKVFLK